MTMAGQADGRRPQPIKFIDLAAQQTQIRADVDRRIAKVLDHGQYIMGPEVRELEAALAEFCKVGEVISCSNGTDALWLPLLAWEVGSGDAVFIPSFTFTATAEAVALTGASPVFVDVEPDSFNIDTESLAAAIDQVRHEGSLRPRGIIAVDLFGLPADYPALGAIAEANNLWVMADAAQSFGGRRGNSMVGAMADVTTTSFFPAKPLGCYGDGGAIFTADVELAEKIRSIRIHGRGTGKYDNIRVGTNARLDALQAAVLLAKLEIFPGELQSRQLVALRYSDGLEDLVKVPRVPEGSLSAWAQYTIRCEGRDEVAQALKAPEIPTQIYCPKAIHQQEAYKHHDIAPGGLPVSEGLCAEVLSLPMHPYLDAETQGTIVEAIKQTKTKTNDG